MKKLTKVITAAGLAAVLGVSAIAAGQLIPINVDPSIKILVNGEEFKPTDANGNEVMTFSRRHNLRTSPRACRGLRTRSRLRRRKENGNRCRTRN